MGQFLELHRSPAVFREALSFTEAKSGFSQRLIEKDYYCSLILSDLEPLFASGLAFKGGTCLSKVHADFYRMSEDLDFMLSIATTASRADRRTAVAPVKRHFENLGDRMMAVDTLIPLRGHDNGRQYNAVLQYESAVTGEPGKVEVQVSVREPIFEPTVSCVGRTLLRHPMPGEVADAELLLRVLSLRETYAEKVRAVLTRDPPAIRDLFDIDDAVRKKRLDLSEPEFLVLVRQKLALPGIASLDTSRGRRQSVEGQLETHLKPVLRSPDYAAFDIGRAFAEVEILTAMIRRDRRGS